MTAKGKLAEKTIKTKTESEFWNTGLKEDSGLKSQTHFVVQDVLLNFNL